MRLAVPLDLVVDENCDVLVEQGGWSCDASESRLAETLAALLLGESQAAEASWARRTTVMNQAAAIAPDTSSVTW